MKLYTKADAQSAGQYFCPECGTAMEKSENFCCRCQSFVDWKKGRTLAPEEVTDSMLDSLLQRSNAQRQSYQPEAQDKKGTVGVRCIIAGVIALFTLILAPVGLILIGVGMYKLFSVKDPPMGYLSPEQMSGALSRYLVPEVLQENLDRVEEYCHSRCFRPQTVHQLQLMEKPYNKTEGSDYLRAVHRGIPFERADMLLTREYKKAGGFPASEQVFRGSLLIATLRNPVPEDVIIWEQNSMGKSFEERYRTESRHPETAAALLTPERKQWIRQLNAAVNGQLTMKLTRNGLLCIAVAADRDLFQVSGRETSAAAVREHFRQDAALIGRAVSVLACGDLCKTQPDP